MKRLIAFTWVMLLTFFLFACGEENHLKEMPELPTEQPGDNVSHDNGGSTVEQTAITLTIGDKVLDAYLNGNTAAADLLSRLPVTVWLNNSGHDYCGGIHPALAYKEDEVQYGWHDGDLAFWTVGNDFVIFHSGEASSSTTGDIVVIGRVISDLEEIRALGSSIEVTIDRKKNSGNSANDNNQIDDDMNKTQFYVK